MEYYVKSVISIIESNYHKLTSAEKTVADFFIHNNQNTDFSSSHIAELLYTSKATLSRFAKKIGYRGYQEFIYQYENTFEEKEEKITGNPILFSSRLLHASSRRAGRSSTGPTLSSQKKLDTKFPPG